MKPSKFALLPLVSILAAIWSGASFGDSAVGVDTLLGNSLNPGGVDVTLPVDREGFSPVMGGKGPSHTPSGQLYLYPNQAPTPVAGDNGWFTHGSVEAGVTGGSGNLNNAGFREYSGFENGAVVSNFAFSAEKPENHTFFNIRGGGIGRKDGYFGLEAGRYNDFKFSAFYNQTPHVFATNARPIWNGVGTGNLTLPAGITPGSVAEATNGVNGNYTALQNAVQALGSTTLELERKKLGVKLEGYLNDKLSGFVGYTNERREGTRPFGGGFLFDFIRWAGASQTTPSGGTYAAGAPGGFYASGGVMETVEPIDYTTHDFLAGLRYVGEKDRYNLTFNGSFFRNDIKSLTWDNPFALGFPGMNYYDRDIDQGRFALSPDNNFYNIKGDYARVLPMDGQFTAVVSLGTMRQNDSLLAPTVNDGIDALGANAAKWTTTSALSQSRANARIDTTLVDLGLSIRPASDLTLRGKLRFYDENNKTDYTAYNPLTGQYGYVALDGGLSLFGGGFSGVYNTALATQNNAIHYKNIPTSYHKVNANLAADYNLTNLTTATAAYDREEIFRDHRERDRTSEDRFKLSVNTRAVEDGTLRLSYEYGKRTGSTYNFDPYKEFYVVEPVGYVHTLADLRKYDIADRTQHILNARFNYMLRSDMDAFVSLQHKLSDFGAQYGRVGDDKSDTLNLEWNYTPSPITSVFTFYSLQKSSMAQRNINDARVATPDPNAGGSYYPLSNAWDASFRDTNHTLGAGFAHAFGTYRLESRYSYAWMKGKSDYGYADAAGATVGSGVGETQTAAQAGSNFSDLRYTQHILETSLSWPVDKNLGVRLFHRYEKREVADWHYDGIGDQLIGQKLYLGNSPEGFKNNMVGVFLQYRM